MLVDGEARGKSHKLAGGEEIAIEPPPAAEEPARPAARAHDRVRGRASPRRGQAGRGRRPPGARSCRRHARAGARWPPAPTGGEEDRPGIVHRLDRDTSGLLVVARSEEAYERLQELVRRRELTREYLALVVGKPRSRRGTIDAPVGRDRHDRLRHSLDTDTPREAVTHFELEELLPRHALLRVRLETGRTHQIRVHLAAIDLPGRRRPDLRDRAGPRPRAAVPPRRAARLRASGHGRAPSTSRRRCRPTWPPRSSARDEDVRRLPPPLGARRARANGTTRSTSSSRRDSRATPTTATSRPRRHLAPFAANRLRGDHHRRLHRCSTRRTAEQGTGEVARRALLARLVRAREERGPRRAAPRPPLGRPGRALRALAHGHDRLPARRRRHARAVADGLDAQPRPHGRCELSRQAPPRRLARSEKRGSPRSSRLRPGAERGQLAVGRRHRHRRPAVVPDPQPRAPARALRRRRDVLQPLGPRARDGRYPEPMLDLAAESAEAKERFRAASR